MGITAKPCGKTKSIFQKLDNELNKASAAMKVEKKEKNKDSKKK